MQQRIEFVASDEIDDASRVDVAFRLNGHGLVVDVQFRSVAVVALPRGRQRHCIRSIHAAAPTGMQYDLLFVRTFVTARPGFDVFDQYVPAVR